MCATGVPGAGGPGCGARPLCVPVGGGLPARSPHAILKARSGRSRGPPWPCRHPPAPRPGPSAPSGALHTSGAWSLIGASSRSPARPRAPAAEPTPNFACNSVATLKSTAPLLTAHHFRPFRARFSLAEAMSVSFSRPHPLAKVPPVSPRCRKVRALALPLSQQDTSSDLSERNTAPALHENVLSQAA